MEKFPQFIMRDANRGAPPAVACGARMSGTDQGGT